MWASWGGFPKVHQKYAEPSWAAELPQVMSERNRSSILPIGLRRSYGDSCTNSTGLAIRLDHLDRCLEFDGTTGLLRCEAGVSLDAILRNFVPRGWFLPVTPGTKFVTVGGAIANDVHGKNHHVGGTFGRHVKELVLRRSDGNTILCSSTVEPDLFAATIGGLGLTGTILEAQVALRPIANAYIEQVAEKFYSLDEFFAVSERLSAKHEYTVAWLDCISGGEQGRGIFMAGSHAAPGKGTRKLHRANPLLSVPIVAPEFLLSPLSMRLFNAAYFYKQVPKVVESVIHYDPFFYPLDAVGDWNRLYGKRGFLQFQCITQREAIREIFSEVVRSQAGSLLAVLKEFGDIKSPGMLSFPTPGVTLALDFPFRGDATRKLFARLTDLVISAGGRLYPAKDALMTASQFRSFYPNWQQFSAFVDPGHASDFARRVQLFD